MLDHTSVKYHDINANSGGVFFVGYNPHRWGQLRDGAQRHLGDAREQWESLYQLATQAVRISAPERLKQLQAPEKLFSNIIEQSQASSGAPASSVEKMREMVAEALQKVVELLAGLPSADRDGGRLLVPDTNALLFKPDLESWRPPSGPWTVVLVPQVLRELDQLKQRPNVGEKAAGVIRRVKEYARRGDTFVGVKVSGQLQLREVAVDPDMGDTLPWLRAGHGDDEMLASVLELRCRDLQAVVAVATRDRNMQNKARLARVPYLDVEDEL